MGRGNLQKRAFQKEGSVKGGSRIDGATHLVQDAIQREDEEARARTVRRGWNRTAGSRYEFAADGVTFESSGGI